MSNDHWSLIRQHIAKGYIYFAMGFSVFVEMLNTRHRAVNLTREATRPKFRRILPLREE